VSNTHGMKWIRHTTRLAIYLRDGLACVWCGEGVESARSLTLDHITPRCRGGTNDPTNLVTACRDCNDRKGDKLMSEFFRHMWDAHGLDLTASYRKVMASRRRVLPREQARELLAARGTIARAVAREASKLCNAVVIGRAVTGAIGSEASK